MSIHWKKLGTAGRIEAIRSVWEEGCSARQIAEHIEGATRNSIIGTYHRHIAHLLDTPLTARPPLKEGVSTPIKEAGRKKKQRIAAPRRAVAFRPEPGVSKPLPAPRLVAHEAHLCGKPLTKLNAHECKFPVNDADVGDLHLFCALPAEGSYCQHHNARAHQAGAVG